MKPTLLLPMAGLGTRFKQMEASPLKPLITLLDKPFFWWATQSALTAFGPCDLVYVVLQEHVDQYSIDRAILNYFPYARIITLSNPTLGAADTVFQALRLCSIPGPLIINDCDHAFYLNHPAVISNILSHQDSAGLLTFNSNNPAYSYIIYDREHNAVGTKEKEVVSQSAIAGCYLFSSDWIFKKLYAEYVKDCQYNELYISGLYNSPKLTKPIPHLNLAYHLSFGTPSEYSLALKSDLRALQNTLVT